MIEYKHKLLSGKPCMIHADFIPAMDLFCRYLEIVGCSALINSSYRNNTDVKGAIVKPAKVSNHLVGCAIDCNIYDKKKVLWNSEMLKTPKLEVLQFINLIRRSNTLRWGGDFQVIDSVHFDNGINIKNRKRYDEIINELYK